MITPEPSDLTTEGLEHPKTEEVEEIGFKGNLMKMIEAIKQEVRTPLKKWKRRQTKS